MIADYTEDTLIEISGLFRAEVYYDPGWRVRLDRAHCLTKAKSIARISVQLEMSWQVTIVNHIKDSVGLSVNIDFAEVQSLWAQLNIEALSFSLATKTKHVATRTNYLKVCAGDNLLNKGRVRDRNLLVATG